MKNSILSADQINELGVVLKKRFEKNMHRHPELSWDVIWGRIIENPDKIQSLYCWIGKTLSFGGVSAKTYTVLYESYRSSKICVFGRQTLPSR